MTFDASSAAGRRTRSIRRHKRWPWRDPEFRQKVQTAIRLGQSPAKAVIFAGGSEGLWRQWQYRYQHGLMSDRARREFEEFVTEIVRWRVEGKLSYLTVWARAALEGQDWRAAEALLRRYWPEEDVERTAAEEQARLQVRQVQQEAALAKVLSVLAARAGMTEDELGQLLYRELGAAGSGDEQGVPLPDSSGGGSGTDIRDL